jgi:aminotransferase EvaB|tara:strand:- start:3102 stop:4205 length:1104 start_codon:yes stop_codon:yes gene_type:complete
MIRVWEYLKEFESERDEIMQAIVETLESGMLVLGENVSSFESEFSSYCSSQYGIGVNSGTDALFLGLKALGIGAGDEVITVANTAVPTVSAIQATGATTKFVDIDPDTYLMDTRLLEAAVTERTKCIIPVHLFGQCVDMSEVKAVAERHSLFVLEDCAQAHGAKQNNEMSGSMSDISAFSFYPTKILGAYGDAGLIMTSNSELADKCKRIRFYGMEQQYYAIEDGFNSRLDEMQAAILRKKLVHLDEYISRRRAIADMYYDLLDDSGLVLPKVSDNNFHSYFLFVARHKKRDAILEYLKGEDIMLNVSYKWPIHTMPAYEYLGYKVGDLPNTELAANEIFSLPMFPSLTGDAVRETCGVLKGALVNC